MKRHTLFFSLAIAAALVLSACTITVEPGPGGPRPPDPDETVPTTTDDLSVAASFTVPANGSYLVQINVRTSQSLLFIELNQELGLEVQGTTTGSTRPVIASSNSAAFFSSGSLTSSAIETEFDALAPAAINEDVGCGGSCVVIPRQNRDVVFARIVNRSGSPRDVDLFAFGRPFQDTGETSNDSPSGAVAIPVGSFDQGAIETIGDQDYWRVTANGTVGFVTSNEIVGLVMRARDAVTGQEFGPFVNGDSYFALAGDLIWVESRLNRAAPAGQSLYTLNHTP